MKADAVLLFLAKFGVCLLLFQIGLESNVNEMRRVGGRALFAASSGVIATTLLCGFVLGRRLARLDQVVGPNQAADVVRAREGAGRQRHALLRVVMAVVGL